MPERPLTAPVPCRILLTGDRGAGKTTLCERVVRELRNREIRPAGILTPKILDRDGRVLGIRVEAFCGGGTGKRTLARTDRRLDGPAIGPYSFSTEGLRFGRKALETGARDGEVLFADELGPLEMRGEGFCNILHLARQATTPPMVIVVRPELVASVRDATAPAAVHVLHLERGQAGAALGALLARVGDALGGYRA